MLLPGVKNNKGVPIYTGSSYWCQNIIWTNFIHFHKNSPKFSFYLHQTCYKVFLKVKLPPYFSCKRHYFTGVGWGGVGEGGVTLLHCLLGGFTGVGWGWGRGADTLTPSVRWFYGGGVGLGKGADTLTPSVRWLYGGGGSGVGERGLTLLHRLLGGFTGLGWGGVGERGLTLLHRLLGGFTGVGWGGWEGG